MKVQTRMRIPAVALRGTLPPSRNTNPHIVPTARTFPGVLICISAKTPNFPCLFCNFPGRSHNKYNLLKLPYTTSDHRGNHAPSPGMVSTITEKNIFPAADNITGYISERVLKKQFFPLRFCSNSTFQLKSILFRYV